MDIGAGAGCRIGVGACAVGVVHAAAGGRLDRHRGLEDRPQPCPAPVQARQPHPGPHHPRDDRRWHRGRGLRPRRLMRPRPDDPGRPRTPPDDPVRWPGRRHGWLWWNVEPAAPPQPWPARWPAVLGGRRRDGCGGAAGESAAAGRRWLAAAGRQGWRWRLTCRQQVGEPAVPWRRWHRPGRRPRRRNPARRLRLRRRRAAQEPAAAADGQSRPGVSDPVRRPRRRLGDRRRRDREERPAPCRNGPAVPPQRRPWAGRCRRHGGEPSPRQPRPETPGGRAPTPHRWRAGRGGDRVDGAARRMRVTPPARHHSPPQGTGRSIPQIRGTERTCGWPAARCPG